MLNKFIRFISQENLHEMNDRILLGVSGGIDSMVMADLYLKAGIQIGIAHCNFKLREKESDKDEQFIEKYAEDQKTPFFSVQFETEKYAKAQHLSIQMAARDLRMNWFSEILLREGYDAVATAHHLDDQVETFFINLLRGTGISGLRGIKPKSGNLIHPILFAARNEITDYAFTNGISYREDSSNLESNYIRNKIRHSIIPELEQIKPGFSHILTKNMDHLRSAEHILQIHWDKTWDSISKKENSLVKIDLKKLRKLQEIPSYLFEFLKPYGFNSSDATRITDSLDSQPGKQFFSKTYRIILDREYLLLEKLPVNEDEKPHEFVLYENEENSNPVGLNFRKYNKEPGFTPSSDPHIAQLDAAIIEFPLTLRKWKRGDRFHPLGMNGNKLVSDFFIDKKFSQIKKEKAWILLSGSQIIWIIGVRIDNRYKISSSTKQVMEFRFSDDC